MGNFLNAPKSINDHFREGERPNREIFVCPERAVHNVDFLSLIQMDAALPHGYLIQSAGGLEALKARHK